MLGEVNEVRKIAEEIASEVLGTFSLNHPDIRMNFGQWNDLREMIEREVIGCFSVADMGASDLLDGNSGVKHDGR